MDQLPAHVTLDSVDDDLPRLHFLRDTLARAHPHVVRRELSAPSR